MCGKDGKNHNKFTPFLGNGAVKSSEISVSESRDLDQGAGDNGAFDAQSEFRAAASPPTAETAAY
jgi:hypothetical protein